MGSSVRSSAAVKRVGVGLGVLAACAAAAPGVAGAALPDGRAYELVSSGDDNLGDVVGIVAVADGGDAVAFASAAGDDTSTGAPLFSYARAGRTGTGWTRSSLNPMLPGGVAPGAVSAQTIGLTPGFDRMVTDTPIPFSAEDSWAGSDLYTVERGTGATTLVSRRQGGTSSSIGFALLGASTDLRRLVFHSWASHGDQLIPGDPTGTVYAYENGAVTRISTVGGAPAWVGLSLPDVSARSGLGGDDGNGMAAPDGGSNLVSADARRVYFDTASGLYLNDHGTTRSVAPDGSTFIAATDDGAVAYVHSSDELTPDATPGGGIYRYDVAGDGLEQVTPDAAGMAGAGVSQALLSDDGSRLYVVARAVLAAGGVLNANNVYVRDGGTWRFITTTPENEPLRRVSRDGRFMVLRSTASLGGAPNGGHAALYRYDAQANVLACVSCRADGSPSQAPATLSDNLTASLPTNYLRARGVSEDGQVVFQTDDALVAEDVNGVTDAYRSGAGGPALLSSGTSPYPSRIGDVTPDGRTMTFVTREALTGSDRDGGLYDVYAARVGGGFAEPPPSGGGVPCHGDACKGAWPGGVPTAPITSTAPSAGNVAAGPPAPPAGAPGQPDAPSVDPSVRLRLGAGAQDRLVAGRKARLRVQVVGAGDLRVDGAVQVGRRTFDLRGQRRRVDADEPATVRVSVRLPRAARRALARGDDVELTLRARLRGAEPHEITLTLSPERR